MNKDELKKMLNKAIDKAAIEDDAAWEILKGEGEKEVSNYLSSKEGKKHIALRVREAMDEMLSDQYWLREVLCDCGFEKKLKGQLRKLKVSI